MNRKREQVLALSFLITFATGMLLYMTFSEPSFSGEIRQAHVLTVDELNRLGQTGDYFLLPVYSDIPKSKQDKCAFYLEPGDKVMVDGVVYNWYRILREDGNNYWVFAPFIRFD